MDWLSLIERYGIPLVVAGLFWVYIQKQQKYITEENDYTFFIDSSSILEFEEDYTLQLKNNIRYLLW